MAIKRDKIKKQRSESTNSSPPPSISNIMENMVGDGSASASLKSALARRDKNTIVAGKFTLKMTGLEIDGEITSDEWLEFASWISTLQDSIQWILGDLVNYAYMRLDDWMPDGEYSEGKYKLFLEQTDYSYSSLRKFASIAGRIAPERRFSELSYSHHVEVADLSEKEQEHYLSQAIEKSWSVRQLRIEVQGEPEKLSEIDTMLNRATSTYTLAAKKAKSSKGRERAKWLSFIKDEAARWQRLAKELDN